MHIVVVVIDIGHLAAVDVVLWCWDAKNGTQQFERGETFVVAKTPQFHRVDERRFPRFCARQIEESRQGNAVNQHTSADEWHIKLFDIVSADTVFVRSEESAGHSGKVAQQVRFVVAGKRFDPHVPLSVFVVNDAHRNANDFGKFAINATAIAKGIFGRCIGVITVGHASAEGVEFFIPQRLQLGCHFVERCRLRHCFDVEEENFINRV